LAGHPILAKVSGAGGWILEPFERHGYRKVKMSEEISADLCVIGAGAGGLSVAAGASQMGAEVVLFEGGQMGGDCLNHGCVPSKALLAAGKALARQRGDARYGIVSQPSHADFTAVKAHVQGVIDAIAPMDSVERFEGLGVRVIQSHAKFTGPRTVEGGGVRVRARRIVVATGSTPMVPPVPGLADGPYLTNETIFSVSVLPEHLLIMGGGPIGIELAQAFRNLDSKVTVVEMARIMAKDDPELVDLLRRRLGEDGIEILEGMQVRRVDYPEGGGVVATIGAPDAEETSELTSSHILVAAGRKPTMEGLDLEAAGIAWTPKGITVDAGLRTTNPRVQAIGDVAGPYQFTHMAGYHAGIAIRRALFRMPAKVDYSAVPWVTYCDPELASVGLSEAEARASHGTIQVLRWPFAENDRAQAERDTKGLVKVIVTPKGRILGAAILGAHAGELIQLWCLAIQQKLKIGAVAGVILPYPTLGEANKRAAGSFYTPKLFSDRVRKIVRFLRWFG
jgi:pyruvate/2-oxoglutarate dehydrogenase complex dihydrolipoamide dehydrogenase (E3) component